MVGVRNLKPLPYTLTNRDRVFLSLLSYYPASWFGLKDLVAGAGFQLTNTRIFARTIPRLLQKGYIERQKFLKVKVGYRITAKGLEVCKEWRVKPFRGFGREIWGLNMSIPA